jgi:hypothetical protein
MPNLGSFAVPIEPFATVAWPPALLAIVWIGGWTAFYVAYWIARDPRRRVLTPAARDERESNSRRARPAAAIDSLGGRRGRPSGRQWEQPFGEPVSSAVRKLEPQPQAATALGLLTVKPAPMSVST